MESEMNRNNLLTTLFLVALFLFGAGIGATVSSNYWKNKGWANAFRSMKTGTIEKEIQTRAPALWIELNKEKKP